MLATTVSIWCELSCSDSVTGYGEHDVLCNVVESYIFVTWKIVLEICSFGLALAGTGILLFVCCFYLGLSFLIVFDLRAKFMFEVVMLPSGVDLTQTVVASLD